MCERLKREAGVRQGEGVLWFTGRRDRDSLGGLIVNLMYWTVVFFSLSTTPRVTHVGAMAFTTVMGFDQEGPLSHSVSQCEFKCVCLTNCNMCFLTSFTYTYKHSKK